jgi:uncharacterized YccA/Bax inhibitor family protein
MLNFKSGNPTLTEKLFQKSQVASLDNTMTVKGTMNKFGFLFLMVMATAFYTWNAFMGGQSVTGLMIGGAIGGLIIAFIIIFKQTWAPFLAPAYALMEGLFVGGISAVMHAAFAEKAPFLIMQAVALTFGTIIAMYFLISSASFRQRKGLSQLSLLPQWVLPFLSDHFCFGLL